MLFAQKFLTLSTGVSHIIAMGLIMVIIITIVVAENNTLHLFGPVLSKKEGVVGNESGQWIQATGHVYNI
jgi:hypothetical protein